MEYFLLEIQHTLEFNKKDTKRKIQIFLSKWIKDLTYMIDHIEPQLTDEKYRDELGVHAWHLGTKYRSTHLKRLKAERQYLEDNTEAIINIQLK